MRIQVTSSENVVDIPIPTALIFNDLTALIGCSAIRKYSPPGVQNLSHRQISVLFAEFRRIKRKYGSWVLVDIQSADGQTVQITL